MVAPVDNLALTAQMTPLQQRTVRELVLHIRQERYPAGHHLKASFLAEQLGVSRSPVNAALAHLAELGVLEHDRNRGFFLRCPADELDSTLVALVGGSEDPLYQRIVDLRLARQLPDKVLESDLMRLLDTSRANLGRVLSRIQEEGWIERRAGQGWEFLSLIDSRQAYEESYYYRLALEPAALLSPDFRADPAELAECLRQQEFIAESGYLSMTPFELFEANSHFHETLALWSHNRFIHQSLVRLDQLRRLVEYRQAARRSPRREQALEHIAILQCIAGGELVEAAALMRRHLNQALRAKREFRLEP